MGNPPRRQTQTDENASKNQNAEANENHLLLPLVGRAGSSALPQEPRTATNGRTGKIRYTECEGRPRFLQNKSPSSVPASSCATPLAGPGTPNTGPMPRPGNTTLQTEKTNPFAFAFSQPQCRAKRKQPHKIHETTQTDRASLPQRRTDGLRRSKSGRFGFPNNLAQGPGFETENAADQNCRKPNNKQNFLQVGRTGIQSKQDNELDNDVSLPYHRRWNTGNDQNGCFRLARLRRIAWREICSLQNTLSPCGPNHHRATGRTSRHRGSDSKTFFSGTQE